MDGTRGAAFAELVRLDREDLDLARAALAVARDEDPGLDPESYVARLDAMADAVRARAGPGAGPRARFDALRSHLFEDLGFRGNLEHYYDPQNSYLHRVLDRRVGIPLTLSVVVLEVGERLGLPVAGVGLPGHFLVKASWPDEETLLDPFNGGAVLEHAGVQQRLDAVYGGKVVLTERFLRAVGKREVLARLLYNLKRVHTRAGDEARALRVLDRLLELQPHAFEDLRDRGLLLHRAGRYAEALRDLRQYRRFLPHARDRGEVERAIEACERLRTRNP